MTPRNWESCATRSMHRWRTAATDQRRAELARRIGEIKQGNLYRPEREAQVLGRVAERNPGPLPAVAAQRIVREIMSACLALEQPLNIAFLGPAGTYSESAARKHFGGCAEPAGL
jgi:chorismate mutase/prephenate dehydratase